MLDDATAFARLDSDLYGALAHVGQIVQRAVGADLAIARVLNGPPVSLSTFVGCPRSGLIGIDENALVAWAEDPHALFGHLSRRRVRDGVFRPRELVDETEFARLGLFRRIESAIRLHDAVCVAFPLPAEAWGVIALLRGGRSPMFGADAISKLERLRPSVARVVTKGFNRETAPKGLEVRMAGDRLVHQPVSAAQMLAKLSRTELQVLGYLRNQSTEREIADHIGRSPHTVHVHVKNIYRKLGVSSRKHLTTLFSP